MDGSFGAPKNGGRAGWRSFPGMDWTRRALPDLTEFLVRTSPVLSIQPKPAPGKGGSDAAFSHELVPSTPQVREAAPSCQTEAADLPPGRGAGRASRSNGRLLAAVGFGDAGRRERRYPFKPGRGSHLLGAEHLLDRCQDAAVYGGGKQPAFQWVLERGHPVWQRRESLVVQSYPGGHESAAVAAGR